MQYLSDFLLVDYDGLELLSEYSYGEIHILAKANKLRQNALTMYVHVDHQLKLLEADLTAAQLNCIAEDLRMENPRWRQQEQFGRWRNTEPRYLDYCERRSGVLLLPRGYASELLPRLAAYQLVDRTRRLEAVDFGFEAELHSHQHQALASISAHRFGVLEAPPGAGKTVMALASIAARRQPALVVVPTRELMHQWHARARQFMNLSDDELGLLGDGHKRPGSKLTIAIINSLYRCAAELSPQVGHLVVDECHHLPARTFTEVVASFDAAFMLGLSATPYRRDGLTRLISLYLGPTTHRISPAELIRLEKIMQPRLELKMTGLKFSAADHVALISEICGSAERNQLIAADAAALIAAGGGPALVISDRVEHCRTLYEMLVERGVTVRLISGQTPAAERRASLADLDSGTAQILVATAQLVGEGFDLKHLAAIFMATPVCFSGRVKQYIGRVLRTADGKEDALIYDYVDATPGLRRAFRSRLKVYQELGAILPDEACKKAAVS